MSQHDPNSPISTLLETLTYSSLKHKDQRRNDSAETPYINHPIRVANYISSVGQIEDIAILQAALLHDTVEDTNTTLGELKLFFGPKVSSIVAEVTDDKQLEKVERKKLQITHAKELSIEAKLVKLADKLHNLNDLISNPPDNWSLERIQGYFVWASYVIDNLRGTNEYLESKLDMAMGSTFTYDEGEYPALPKFADDSERLQQLENYYQLLEK